MPRCIVLLVFLLGMLGCAPEYHWAKPHVSQQEFVKDNYECERSATERAYFAQAWMGYLTMPHFCDQCLLARGYHKA